MTSSISPARSTNYPTDINQVAGEPAKSVDIEKGIEKLRELIQSDDDVFQETEKLLADEDLVDAVKNQSILIVGEAAAKGNLGVLIPVLDKIPADIDTPNEQGMTPIMIASKEGRTAVVGALAAKLADTSKADNKGNTALMWAALSGFQNIVKMLLASLSLMSPDDPKGVNAKNDDGKNSLIFAAEGGHTDTVKLLIDRGADIKARDGRGHSALHYAGAGGHTSTIKRLIENHADVNARDGKDRTPLYYAIVRGHVETAELLIENKADINAKNNEGKTPVMLAAEGGHRDIVKLLIENKADLKARDNKGYPALYYAIAGGHENIVTDFIEAGISLQHFSDDLYLNMTLHDNTNREMLLQMLDPGARYSEKKPSSA